MDVKGITWVGNLYQKFEALCLEVEDNMYEDTVKYVENQVQTVGASVKKFYSDVVQDLLPPSAMDPVKVAAADLPLKKYADAKIYKKSKACSKEEVVKVNIKKKTEDSNVVAKVVKHAGHASSVDGLCCVNSMLPPSSADIVKVACSDFYLAIKNDGGICNNSNVGVKEILNKEDQHPSETLGAITPAGKDLNRSSSFCEVPDNYHEASCEQLHEFPCNSCPYSNYILGHEFEEEEKVRGSGEDTADPSNGADDVSIGHPSSNIRSSSSGGCKPAELNDTSSQNGAVSPLRYSTNGDTQHSESANMEDLMPDSKFGSSAGWSIDQFGSNDEFEQGMETIYVIDKVKLEETCVVVDGDKFSPVPHREGKHKSYKKKIRDAFSSKTKSARKHEYEQLAAQYINIGAGSNLESAKILPPTRVLDSETKQLQSHELCESEWELL